MSTAVRYVLLQVPGWLLAALVLLVLWEREILRPRTALLLFGLYLAKDLVLYPVVRHAYAAPSPDAGARLVGVTGVVRRRLDPRGYVLLNGELWRAEAPVPLEVGTRVRVTGVRGLTVFVAPEPPVPEGGGGAVADDPEGQPRSGRKKARMSATSASGSSSAAK